MNGRVYDPWVGRFLSPDPFVQSPSYSQSYNRYSYVFNNPLKYVDPTGYEGGPNGNPPSYAYGEGSASPGMGFYAFKAMPWGQGNRSAFMNSGSQAKWVTTLSNDGTEVNPDWNATTTLMVPNPDGSMSPVNSQKAEKNTEDIYLGTVTYVITKSGKVIIIGFDNPNGESYFNTTTVAEGGHIVSDILIGIGSSGGGVDATPYVGGALGVSSEVMFSNKFGTWMGKDGIIRSQDWGGNGATGGKFKFAGKVGKFFKWGGSVMGVYGVVDTQVQYQNNEISGTQLIIEQISNGIGFIPTYGTAWSIGWNLGQDFGPSTWYGKNDYKWFE